MADAGVGDRFGAFELLEHIGRGGNADVFRASDGEREVALKILRQRRVDSEPYGRFRREIETLQALGDRPGVLPLVDFELPERLARGERAWLAMPLATPIESTLVESELDEIVAAIAAIAATLADLLSTSGLAHRDLKPQNLYLYDEAFAVGDFGLVSLPDAERLTAPGKVIGPAHFVAYEMMEHPLEADPAPADVYSLAKTLWVLATGLGWPPPGHQPAEQSHGVGEYRPHVHAAALDRLIDRSTRLNPAERPSMSAFANDLNVWLELPAQQAELADLAALGVELRRRAAPHVEASAAADRRSAAANALYERFERGLEPVTAAISESFPNLGGADGSYLTTTLGTSDAFGEAPVRLRYAAGATLRDYAELDPVLLRYGGLIEVLDDGDVRVCAGIGLGHGETFGGDAWVGETAEAPAGSLAAEALVDAAVAELIERLPAWVRRFLDATT